MESITLKETFHAHTLTYVYDFINQVCSETNSRSSGQQIPRVLKHYSSLPSSQNPSPFSAVDQIKPVYIVTAFNLRFI
jgi:hypothetical protein